MNVFDRKNRVLSSIVELYIRTGEPVGSKAVSADLNDVCSTATIRNDMCEWIERGLLIQPHTSAGRVPSGDGFRYYIENLMPEYRLSTAEQMHIQQLLPAYRGDTDLFLSQTAKLLSELSKNTVLITPPGDPNAVIRRVELIPVDPQTVLVAVLTSSGQLKSKICHLTSVLSAKDAERLMVFLNQQLADVSLGSITPATAQTLALGLGTGALNYASLLDLVFDAIGDASRPRLLVEGQTNLLLYKEFSPVSVIDLFSRQEVLLDCLERPQGFSVIFGSDMKDPALHQASLIVSDYTVKRRLHGRLGVLGPLKEDYFHLLPLVRFVSKTVEDRLNQAV